MCRQGVNGSVLQVLRGLASGPPNGESFCSQPVSEPSHVAVAVERIGDQIERLERDQSIKSSRSHTGDLIGVQRQRLQVQPGRPQLLADSTGWRLQPEPATPITGATCLLLRHLVNAALIGVTGTRNRRGDEHTHFDRGVRDADEFPHHHDITTRFQALRPR